MNKVLRIGKIILKGFAILIGIIFIGLLIAYGFFVWERRSGHDVTTAITPQGQRDLSAEPASIEARRQQYLAQYKQIWSIDDYPTVRKKAQDGNPLAQRRLYEIYEYCLDIRSSTTVPLLRQMATVNKRVQGTLQQVQAEYERACLQSAAGKEATGESFVFWMQQSAKSGDLVSQMRVLTRTVGDKMTRDQLKDLIQRAALSGDPAAVMEIGVIAPQVKQLWADPVTAPAIHSKIASHAWVIAACRAGMDCNRGSRLMVQVCLRVMSCQYENYEAFLYADALPAAQRPQIEMLVAMIQKTLLKPGKNP
jgi:hypothetical protein